MASLIGDNEPLDDQAGNQEHENGADAVEQLFSATARPGSAEGEDQADTQGDDDERLFVRASSCGVGRGQKLVRFARR